MPATSVIDTLMTAVKASQTRRDRAGTLVGLPLEVLMKRLMAGLLVLAASTQAYAGDRSAAEQPAPAAKAGPPMLSLQRGTRLRLYLDDGQPRVVEGRLQDADGRTVTVDTGGGHSRRFPREELRGVAYRSGGRDRMKGAGIGAAITGAAGFIACAIAYENELERTLGPDRGNGQGLGLLCGLAGMVAAAPGFGIGYAIGTTGGDWNGVTPEGFAMTGAAAARRPGVAVRLRFTH
jgi:hypothetical protein